MSKPYEDKTISIIFPEAPDAGATVSVYHEYGDAIIEDAVATADTATNFSYNLDWKDLDSAGVYRVEWTANFATVATTRTSSFVLEDQYITYAEFDTRNEFISISEDTFNKLERSAREIVDTYCGQSFQAVVNKTRNYYGSGKDTLHLNDRITKLTTVTIDGEDDTAYFEIDRRSHRFLRFKQSLDGSYIIGKSAEVSILGDWGWSFVPQNVEDAMDLVIQDLVTDDRASHRYNVVQSDHDTRRVKYGNSMFETVGNLDADVLLMDYILFEIGYVSE